MSALVKRGETEKVGGRAMDRNGAFCFPCLSRCVVGAGTCRGFPDVHFTAEDVLVGDGRGELKV